MARAEGLCPRDCAAAAMMYVAFLVVVVVVKFFNKTLSNAK